ncbi:hypothetical protein KVT40_009203 [Elsinoe batatas]|uniref:Uncharacterized protein n=1 Tax=Elsinoe batatas TaxID=2601811 RepID=A0A8K0PD46_9PEZI|nr:hypothetical protein KVT40_009203 [Elsinoe batatas]
MADRSIPDDYKAKSSSQPSKLVISAVAIEKVNRRSHSGDETTRMLADPLNRAGPLNLLKAATTAGALIDTDKNIDALRSYVFDNIRHRLAIAGADTVDIKQEQLQWLLPKTLQRASDWIRLLEDAPFVAPGTLTELLGLEDIVTTSSTRTRRANQTDDSTSPEESHRTFFYIRTLCFSVNELLHVLAVMLSQGHGSFLRLQDMLAMLSESQIAHDEPTRSIYIRYCGQTVQESPKARWNVDMQDAKTRPASFNQFFLATTLRLYPEIINGVIIQIVRPASIRYLDEAAADFREMVMIALFWSASLNTELGGKGKSMKPSLADQQAFDHLNSDTYNQFKQCDLPLDRRVDMAANIAGLAREALAFIKERPELTNPNRHNVPEDTFTEVVVKESSTSPAGNQQFTPLLLLGNEKLDAQLKTPFTYIDGRSPISSVLCRTFNQLIQWELAFSQVQMSSGSLPDFVPELVGRNQLPFWDLYQWYKPREGHMIKGTTGDGAKGLDLTRRYLSAAQPLVIMCFGNHTIRAATQDFETIANAHMSIQNYIGQLEIIQYSKSPPRYAVAVYNLRPSYVGTRYGQASFAAHSTFLAVCGLAWSAAGLAMKYKDDGDSKIICDKIIAALQPLTSADTIFGKHLALSKRIYSEDRPGKGRPDKVVSDMVPRPISTKVPPQLPSHYNTASHHLLPDTKSPRWSMIPLVAGGVEILSIPLLWADGKKEIVKLLEMDRCPSAEKQRQNFVSDFARKYDDVAVSQGRRLILQQAGKRNAQPSPGEARTAFMAYLHKQPSDRTALDYLDQAELIAQCPNGFRTAVYHATKIPNDISAVTDEKVRGEIIANFTQWLRDNVFKRPDPLNPGPQLDQIWLKRLTDLDPDSHPTKYDSLSLTEQALRDAETKTYYASTGSIAQHPIAIVGTWMGPARLTFKWAASMGAKHYLVELRVHRDTVPPADESAQRFMDVDDDGIVIKNADVVALGVSGDVDVTITSEELAIMLERQPDGPQFLGLIDRQLKIKEEAAKNEDIDDDDQEDDGMPGIENDTTDAMVIAAYPESTFTRKNEVTMAGNSANALKKRVPFGISSVLYLVEVFLRDTYPQGATKITAASPEIAGSMHTIWHDLKGYNWEPWRNHPQYDYWKGIIERGQLKATVQDRAGQTARRQLRIALEVLRSDFVSKSSSTRVVPGGPPVQIDKWNFGPLPPPGTIQGYPPPRITAAPATTTTPGGQSSKASTRSETRKRGRDDDGDDTEEIGTKEPAKKTKRQATPKSGRAGLEEDPIED